MIITSTLAYKKHVEIVDTYKTTEFLYVFPSNGSRPYSELETKLEQTGLEIPEGNNWYDIYGCYLYNSRTTENRK
jgi:hypothetical protein